MHDSFIFSIGAGTYGLPAAAIQQTLPNVSPQLIPWMPPFHRGLFQVRGEIFPLLDIRSFINEADAFPQQETSVLVVNTGTYRFGTLTGTPRFVPAPAEPWPMHPESSIWPALDADAEHAGMAFILLNPERLMIQITRHLREQFSPTSNVSTLTPTT
jgi:hypothetical protein